MKTIRWGILGTALIAEKVKRAIDRAEGNDVVAVASRSAEKAGGWARKHGVERAVGSYDELVSDRGIDAVYIPLPPSMHAQWTIAAARAGKHVLCEKPLSATLAETESMLEETRRAGVLLMDGVMWVHHDRAALIRKLLGEGAVGELRRLTAAFTFCFDPIPRGNIRLRPDLGGGCLGDLGYYCVRAIWFTFGVLPTRVFASGRVEHGVDYSVSALCWMPDGRTAAFDCGFDIAMRQWFEIAGTKASIVCDDFVLPRQENRARFWIHDAEGDSREHAVRDCVQEVRMIEHFADAVRAGTGDEAWRNDALATMRICDAIARSFREERVVDLSA